MRCHGSSAVFEQISALSPQLESPHLLLFSANKVKIWDMKVNIETKQHLPLLNSHACLLRFQVVDYLFLIKD